MKFYIDSSVLGTFQHFLYDDGNLSWVLNTDDSEWILTNEYVLSPTYCLLTLAKLKLTNISLDPSKRHRVAMD